MVVFDFGLIYNKFIGVKSETIGVRAVGRKNYDIWSKEKADRRKNFCLL